MQQEEVVIVYQEKHRRQDIEPVEKRPHIQREKIERKDLKDQHSQVFVKYDDLINSRILRAIKVMKPLIVLSLIQLIFGAFIGYFMWSGIRTTKLSNLVIAAQNIISDFRTQYYAPGYSSFQNTDYHLYPSVGCAPGYQLVKFSSLPSTSKGCICPDLQTSTQICNAPCEKVENLNSITISNYSGTSLCFIAASNSTQAFNHIKQIEDPKHHQGLPNMVKIGQEWYHFERDPNGQTEFYQFQISAFPPCVNPNVYPKVKSHLVYPFSNKPRTGCDIFGDKSSQVAELSSILQGLLYDQNNITQESTQLPFFNIYYRWDEPLNLYMVRKWYIKTDEQCQGLLSYPFDVMWNSCLLIQVWMQMLCYFLWILFFMALVLIVFGVGIRRLLNQELLLESIQRTQKWLLIETSIRSVLIIAISEASLIIISKIIYEIGMQNTYGLDNSQIMIRNFFSLECFNDIAINRALTYLKEVTTKCSVHIDKYFEILLGFNVLVIVLAATIVYYKKHQNKQKQQ